MLKGIFAYNDISQFISRFFKHTSFTKVKLLSFPSPMFQEMFLNIYTYDLQGTILSHLDRLVAHATTKIDDNFIFN